MYPFDVFLKKFGSKYPHLQPSTPSSFLLLPLSRPPPIFRPDPALPPLALLLPLAALLLVNQCGARRGKNGARLLPGPPGLPLLGNLLLLRRSSSDMEALLQRLVARSGVASGARRRSGKGGRAGSGRGESVGGGEPALGSTSGGERPEVELDVEELGGGHGGRRRSSGASRGGRRRGGQHCSQRGRAEPARTAARLRAPCARSAASERRRRAGQRRRSRVSGTVAANAPS